MADDGRQGGCGTDEDPSRSRERRTEDADTQKGEVARRSRWRAGADATKEHRPPNLSQCFIGKWCAPVVSTGPHFIGAGPLEYFNGSNPLEWSAHLTRASERHLWEQRFSREPERADERTRGVCEQGRIAHYIPHTLDLQSLSFFLFPLSSFLFPLLFYYSASILLIPCILFYSICFFNFFRSLYSFNFSTWLTTQIKMISLSFNYSSNAASISFNFPLYIHFMGL